MKPCLRRVLAVSLFLAVMLAATEPISAGPLASEADTSASETYDGYLDLLQRQDEQFYSPEILEVDPSLRDSALAALDSLGLAEYQHRARSRRPRLEFGLVPAGRIMDYNRVEGLVTGLAGQVETRNGFALDLQGAYATASKKFRHLESFRFPLGLRGVSGEVGYADRVRPYGSNRPTANWLRAFAGSADEQDYLRSEGGWARIALPAGRYGGMRLGYEAAKESSIDARTDVAVFGDSRLMGFNLPIDGGYDRALVVDGNVGSLNEGGEEMEFMHRVAGGGLGGDFTYTRSELHASARRYVVADHELMVNVGFVNTGGFPPVQRIADIGGLSTVRGFSRRTVLGKRTLNVRAEVSVPYDFLSWTRIPVLRDLRLQLVPWADAGRGWEGNRETWITSVGAGVQRYLGPFGRGAYLRLDAAFPTGPDRPETVRWYLHFARALF